MNIYDIAEKCGVSIATVSRVLNNNPNVSAATRAKIQAVIDEANYTPSALARTLGTGAEVAVPAAAATDAVGILCTTIRDPYYADMLATLEESLRQRGISVCLRTVGDSPAAQQQTIAAMQNTVRAIICVGPLAFDTAPAVSVPLILVDGYADAANVYGVTADHRGAIAGLVRLLMRRQRRRILFLYHRADYSQSEKATGYREALETVGIPYDPALVLQVGNRPEDVNACIKNLLVKRVTFDAVIATEDGLALGAQKALQRTGLNMPIIGYGNSLIARCATPELSSVDCGGARLCAEAVAILEDLLAGREARTHVTVPTQLVERDSFRNN